MMGRLVLTVITAVSAIGCAVTTPRVYPVAELGPAATDPAEGVYYALPRTVLEVTVPVKLTVDKPGEFVEYYKNGAITLPESINAQIASGLLVPILDGESRNYKIAVPSIQLTSRAEPDPEHFYFVELQPGNNALANRSALVALSDAGLITDAGAVVEDKRLDFALKAVETTLKIAAPISTLDMTPEETERLLAEAEEKAEQLRRIQKEILELEERMVAIGANAPAPLEQMWADQHLALKKRRDNLLQVFIGTTETLEWTGKFSYAVPSFETEEKTQILFRFNDTHGIDFTSGITPDNGAPTWISRSGGTNDLTYQTYRITVQKPGETQLSVVARDSSPAQGNKARGFYYRLPATTVVAVEADTEDSYNTALRTEMQVTQLGRVRSLPSKFNQVKKATYEIGFHSGSGALKKVNLGTDVGDPAIIDPTVQALVDYRAARAKAQAEEEAAEQARKEAQLARIKEFLGAGSSPEE